MDKKVSILLILALLAFFAQIKPEGAKTFTFWTVQLKAPCGDLIQKNIDEFQKKYPDLKIVWVDIPIAEAKKRAAASILGGSPPDLINLNPEYSLLLAQRNTLEFLTEDDIRPYNRALVNKLKYEGKIYALPFYATSAVTIYNKEKFKKCELPETYDDILKLEKCETHPVFGAALNEGDSFAKILNKYGANSKEDFTRVFGLFNDMRQKELLLKDSLNVNHLEVVEKYMANSAAFIQAGSNFITIIRQNAPDIYENSDVAPQITGKSGQFDISLMNFVIPKKSKNKELAKEFAFLLLNVENQTELAKKTNVLPVNNEALNSDYFKNCGEDLTDKARCLAANQLNNPVETDFGYKNQNQINELINEALETLFLEGKSPTGVLEGIRILQKE